MAILFLLLLSLVRNGSSSSNAGTINSTASWKCPSDGAGGAGDVTFFIVGSCVSECILYVCLIWTVSRSVMGGQHALGQLHPLGLATVHMRSMMLCRRCKNP